MNCSLSLCLVLGALPLIFGCADNGGQTGEETGNGCVETKTALELTQPSPLGFSAQDLLETTGDALTAPGSWVPITNLPYGPENGASSFSLSLGAMRQAAFVTSKASGDQAITLEQCADRLEVTLSASASTTGGALDEQFPAVLKASSAGDVSLWQQFEPAKLSGQFAFDSQALGAKRFTGLTLSGHWLAGSFFAELSAGIEESSGSGPGSSVSFMNPPVACFTTAASPNASSCTR